VLAAELDNPVALALTGSRVLWTEVGAIRGTNGAVNVVDRSCAEPKVLASGGDPESLVVTAVGIFAADTMGMAILQIAEDAGPPAPFIAGEPYPSRLVSDGVALYWTGPAGIRTATLAGGPASTLAAATCPEGIATDGINVFFTDRCETADAVRVVPAAGGTPTSLAADTNGAGAIALDDANVYWLNSKGGRLMKVAKAGGAPTAIDSGFVYPTALAVDASGVYVADLPTSGRGLLVRTPLDGGQRDVLLDAIGGIRAIVLDGGSVFWVDDGGIAARAGRLLKRAKT
jgi:hypothetical protein